MASRFPNREHAAYLRRQDDGETWRPDAVISVDLSPSWSITDHPVEDGVTVSDHIQRQPQSITIVCIVTENIPDDGGALGGVSHLREQTEWLLETANGGRLVDIVTTKRGVFSGYAIQAAPHAIDNVSRLQFSLQLREIRVATATIVFITVEDVGDYTDEDADVATATSAPDEVDTGEQATTDTSTDEAAEEEDQSILLSLLT